VSINDFQVAFVLTSFSFADVYCHKQGKHNLQIFSWTSIALYQSF